MLTIVLDENEGLSQDEVIEALEALGLVIFCGPGNLLADETGPES